MKKETKYKLKMFGPNMKTWPAGIIGGLYIEDKD